MKISNLQTLLEHTKLKHGDLEIVTPSLYNSDYTYASDANSLEFTNITLGYKDSNDKLHFATNEFELNNPNLLLIFDV